MKRSFATGAVFLGSLLAGGGAAALLACLVGLPTLRLTSDYLGIATLGFGIIMKVLFDNADSFLPQLGGARGMTGIARLTGIPWAVAGLVTGYSCDPQSRPFDLRARTRRHREDEVAAAAMGIDTLPLQGDRFHRGVRLRRSGGRTVRAPVHVSAPEHVRLPEIVRRADDRRSRGLGNMTGTLVASFAWVFLLEGMRVALPPEYIEFRWVLIPLLLIVTMLVRPRGLFGVREFPFLRSKVYR